MRNNYNYILDWILIETIKRKNIHPDINSSLGGTFKSERIIINKEIIEKFKIEDYEVESLYYELTNNWYINHNTGNVTLKGIEFINDGGFIQKNKTEINKNRLNILQFWVIVVAGIFAVLYYLDMLTGNIFSHWLLNYFCYCR